MAPTATSPATTSIAWRLTSTSSPRSAWAATASASPGRACSLGHGAWNEAGFAFYERLVEGLRARPQGLSHAQPLGPAASPARPWRLGARGPSSTSCAMRVVARRFGSRVDAITTHNGPGSWPCSATSRASLRRHQDRRTMLQVAHHLLVSHGATLRALRQDGCPQARHRAQPRASCRQPTAGRRSRR